MESPAGQCEAPQAHWQVKENTDLQSLLSVHPVIRLSSLFGCHTLGTSVPGRSENRLCLRLGGRGRRAGLVPGDWSEPQSSD